MYTGLTENIELHQHFKGLGPDGALEREAEKQLGSVAYDKVRTDLRPLINNGNFPARPDHSENLYYEPAVLHAVLNEFYGRSSWPTELAHWWSDHSITWSDVCAFAGFISWHRVRFFPGRLFDFDDDGIPAIVIEALGDDAATTIDLVAWPAHRPDKFATALGRASGLGVDRVANPATYFLGSPLKLFRTPLGWLEAGCAGAVVLDADLAPPWLSQALGDIAGEDLDHAREIASMLRGHVDVDRIVAPVQAA